jgi:hypothetical protein
MADSEPRAPRVVRVSDIPSAEDSPPKRRPRTSPADPLKDPIREASAAVEEEGKRPKWARDLKEELEGNYQMIGTVLGFAAKTGMQQAAAVNFVESAGAAADSWVDVAEKNPKIKAALLKFTSGTAFAQVISIHFAMLTPVLAGYGVVPESAGAMILMASMSDEQKAAMAAAQAAQNGHNN